ncbi:rhomboid family intramembrane serine protease [Thermococcus sp.]|uniref:rhomboid family intramembrane serine protease n=1 Tax=Thermococcus sp. TaxID=35749 RepID=UPI002603E29E|nr:rhomboid family intramembrane serine protease [Thermococcus sp.]
MNLERYFYRYGEATFTLFLINSGVYTIEAILSRNPFWISDRVLAFLGQWNYAVTHGAWWQLFTAMFVHVSIIHIGFNMYFLLVLGSQLERILGPKRLALTYILSGLAGNLLTLAVMSPYVISAGASGAIFGIAGALITINGVIGRNMQGAIINAFILFILNSILPGVNAYAHLGGLLMGMLIGYYYGQRIRRRLSWAYGYW